VEQGMLSMLNSVLVHRVHGYDKPCPRFSFDIAAQEIFGIA
jgi:hypothetical protein